MSKFLKTKLKKLLKKKMKKIKKKKLKMPKNGIIELIRRNQTRSSFSLKRFLGKFINIIKKCKIM